MTRKEMIETIAKEANCSKRLVRKKLFGRYLELKKSYPHILFYKVFLDRNTNWHNFNEERNYRQPNSFRVVFVPSGCIVIFRNIDTIRGEDIIQTGCGAKLYNW